MNFFSFFVLVNMLMFFTFITGCAFGSFLGLVADRWDSEKSLIWGRSYCASCNRTLIWKQLIPLLSQIIYKSRCFYCQERYPYSYFILEFLTGNLFIAVWLGLDLLHFMTLVLSLLLSKFDIDSLSYPLNIGVGSTAIFFICFPATPSSYFWLFLAICSSFINLKIGAGDFLWLCLASFSLSFTQTLYVLQIASTLGICFLFVKKRRELPFIPFLSLAYLIVIFLPQNL